jgi:hypothetical protein
MGYNARTDTGRVIEIARKYAREYMENRVDLQLLEKTAVLAVRKGNPER